MSPLRIWLVGFGTVGRWLAGALDSPAARIAGRYGVDVRVVGIASAHNGFIYDGGGLDLGSAREAALAGRSFADQHGVGHWPTAIDGVTNAVVCQASPVGEVTIIGPGAGPQLAGQGVLSDIIAVARSRARSS